MISCHLIVGDYRLSGNIENDTECSVNIFDFETYPMSAAVAAVCCEKFNKIIDEGPEREISLFFPRKRQKQTFHGRLLIACLPDAKSHQGDQKLRVRFRVDKFIAHTV